MGACSDRAPRFWKPSLFGEIDMDALIKALRDKQFLRDTGQGLTDSVNRGAIAGLLGGPVDAVSGVVNAGLMGLGYAGNKLGLLGADRMPQPIQKPVGGSEWIGDLLQRGKMVSENRNAPAEMLAGLLAPSAVKGAGRAAFAAEESLGPKAKQMAQQGIESYMVKSGQMLPATVWHGSPHKFDKFDSSKIGTGEGAQAYGHGLYLAESPKVAGQYSQVLSDAAKLTPEGRAARALAENGDDLIAAKQAIYKEYNVATSPAMQNAAMKAIEALQSGKAKSPQLYKVDLPDEHIAKMLDWDKPLSQQAPEVQKALLDLNNPVINAWKQNGAWEHAPNGGESAYRLLANGITKSSVESGKTATASDLLRERGVTGIRYLDQGSRSTGQGTSNFVVFPGNEGLLKILERNGQPIK